MISKVRYPNGRTYVCDGCKKAVGKFTSLSGALTAGWAVSRGRENCYCPACAPKYRHVGRRGAPAPSKPRPDWLPAGYEQTEINLG